MGMHKVIRLSAVGYHKVAIIIVFHSVVGKRDNYLLAWPGSEEPNPIITESREIPNFTI